jgi:hypothetical protein
VTWLQRYLGALITMAALLVGGAIGYGRIQQICTQVDRKADKEAMTREIDGVARRLERMEQKLDQLLLQQRK